MRFHRDSNRLQPAFIQSAMRFPLALSVAAFLAFGQAASAEDYTHYDTTGNVDEYARYTDQASQMFNNGQLTQAIELFERAMGVAPEQSLPVVYNNLAVVYIRRGNYFIEHRQHDAAINDFRKAHFYLESAWPEGMERKPLHEKNRQVSKENLAIGYRNLGINAADKNKHLEMAKQLRMQGKFPEAIVEYEQVLQLDKGNAVAAKALGDLFTVVNLPEKSKKYYSVAVDKGIGGTAGGSEDETLVQLGNAQYKTGEIDKAVQSFDKALAINPGNVSALNMVEKIWLNEIKFNPTSVPGHANLGSVYQKKKMYDQALQQYNAAEHFSEQDPKTSFETKKLIRLNLGTLFQEKKQFELAGKAYDTVLQVEPNHVQANYYKATLMEEVGNFDGALQAYNKVLATDPNHKAAQSHMLALIKKQPDPAKQAEGLKQYADRFASNATIQAQMGEEFHQRKDLNAAAFYYQRALQRDPKLASAWANLGAVYQAQGKDEQSADAFRKAQELDPGNETFKQLAQEAVSGIGYKAYHAAVELQQQGKPQEAIAQFKKAIATSDTADIRAAYGVSLQSAGQLDEAIAQYQQAIAKAPENADYPYYLGTAYHQKNNLAQAQAAYKKAIALRPDYKEAKDALVSIEQAGAAADLEKAIDAYNKQNYAAALATVNQSLAKNGQDAMSHYYKGLILDAQKKPSAAIQSYREAIRLKPDFTDAFYALGVDLDNVKDGNGAKNAFEKFLDLSGSNDDDFVKYARDRLKTLSSQ
jgi:tetratricopeptide (TPR) repeat protein